MFLKSVIMAGGMGTRLRPLTYLKPKPLVAFLGQPMIDHVLSHLEKNGITEHILTLYHLPQMIIDHLLAQDKTVDFTIEKEPRGTAGSVKEAASFLKETFVVASGDALTDIDIKKAMDFHRKNQAIATMVLTRVAEPLEYGVVLTKADGRITRFLEKPTWGEVFSDTVNTGIYILEPKVLELIPPGRSYDFSKDLFPALLKADLNLYGYIADGYWSDVGSINQYRESHWDVLSGQVEGLKPYISEDAKIDPSAMIRQPVAVLKNATIGPGVKLGPFAVVGQKAVIEKDSSLSYTIVGANTYIGKGVIAEGAIIDERAFVGDGSRLLDGTIVSEGASIGEQSLLTPRVRVYPEKRVGPMSVVNSDLIYGSIERGQLFTQKGLRGRLHKDFSLDMLVRLGVSFVEAIDAFSVATACDGSDKARLIKRLISAGAMAKGADLFDLGDQILPSFKIGIKKSETKGGFYIFAEDDYVIIRFLDEKGCYIPSSTERKIENLVKAGDGLNPDIEPGNLYFVPNNLAEYLKEYPDLVLPQKIICHSPAGRRLVEVLSPKEDLGISAQVSSSGENCRIWDETGHELTSSEIESLCVYMTLKDKPGKIKVPINATSALEEIASEFGVLIERAKPGLCHSEDSVIPWHDAFLLLSLLCKERDESLGIILKRLPKKTQLVKELNCPLEKKSQAMLRFASEFSGDNKKQSGLFYRSNEAFAYLQPDEIRPVIYLTVEGNTMEIANELATRIGDMLL